MTIADTAERPAPPAAERAAIVVARGRAAGAVALDVLLVLAPLLLVPLLGLTRFPVAWAWLVAGGAVLLTWLAVLAAVGRTGSSPGRRACGVRTVGRASLQPPSPRDLLRGRVVNADLRAGHDPLELVPSTARPATASVRHDGWQATQPAGRAWLLSVDDGQQIEITRSTLLGRAPTDADGGDHDLVSIPDLTRSISRVHALVEPDEDCLWLTDHGTTKGTRASTASATGGTVIERWLRPGERVAVGAGGTIHLGDRSLRVARSGPRGG